MSVEFCTAMLPIFGVASLLVLIMLECEGIAASRCLSITTHPLPDDRFTWLRYEYGDCIISSKSESMSELESNALESSCPLLPPLSSRHSINEAKILDNSPLKLCFLFHKKKHQNKTKSKATSKSSWHFPTLIQYAWVCVVHMQIKLVLAPVFPSLFPSRSTSPSCILSKHTSFRLNFMRRDKQIIHTHFYRSHHCRRHRLLLCTRSGSGDCSIDYWLLWSEAPLHTSVWHYADLLSISCQY